MRYRLSLVVCLVLAALGFGAGPAVGQTFGVWTPTGALNTGRFLAATALLPNGDVLVAGGITSDMATPPAIASSEIYNPATGGWLGVAPMGSPRAGAVAVTLKNGNVLVVGGAQDSASTGAYDTAEVYDPTTNVWSATANAMGSPRAEIPTATLLNNGDVLIAGGADSTNTPQATADIYDPATNSFTPAAEMEVGATPEPRFGANAILLKDGDVLVAGGAGTGVIPLATALVYDPTTNTWAAPLNTMSTGHALGASGLLPNGDAIITGGESQDSPAATTSATDIYQPSTNSFVSGPAIPGAPGLAGYATVSGGRLLVAGGVTEAPGGTPSLVSGTEIYDPATNSWDTLGSLPGGSLAAPSLVTLANGQVLAAGGTTDEQNGLAGADLLTPTQAPGQPQGVAATAGNGTAQVTFAPPGSDGGSTIEHYTITASTGQTVATPDARTVMTVTGLTNGKPVTFTVTATNELGTSPTSASSSAVTPEGPPKLTLSKLPSKLKLKAFLKGLTFKITPDQPVTLSVTLLGRVGQATIASAYDLTLASASTKLSATPRTIRLKPSKKLVGKPRKAKVEVVIVATSALGTSATAIKTIAISGG